MRTSMGEEESFEKCYFGSRRSASLPCCCAGARGSASLPIGFFLAFRRPRCCLLSYFIPLTIPHEAPDSRSFLSDFAADESACPTRIYPTLDAHEPSGRSNPGWQESGVCSVATLPERTERRTDPG